VAIKLKLPLKWYGGKTKLVKKLLPLVPKHQTYVKVFADQLPCFSPRKSRPSK